jgi:transposase
MQKRQVNGGRKNKKGRPSLYDVSYKRMIVQAFQTSNLSCRQFGKQHNITESVLRYWVSKFSSDIAEEIPTPFILIEQESQDLETLKRQNDELAKKLSYAQMKITGLEVMIDIAEKDLNIEIRKKSGTKQ